MVKLEKGKIINVIGLLKTVFTTTVLLLIVLAVITGTLFGTVLEVVTNVDKSVDFILVCIISNIFAEIAVLVVFALLIKKTGDNFGNVAKLINSGDLSVSMDLKDNKLLSRLGEQLNSITGEMRRIIEGTYELTKAIVKSSFIMSDKVEKAMFSVTEIEKTIDQIAIGASDQVAETQQSVEKIEELSNHIVLVNNSYHDVIKETDNANQLNKEGLNTVEKLREKSDECNVSSEKISRAIENLTKNLENIGLFVATIQSIAEQTNLLALNANIEAARAGDAGKGFAVVADEVRKLSEESRKSTEEITSMMSNIKKDSMEVIDAMKLMESVSKEQRTAVDQTDVSFNKIAESIELITLKINETSNSIKKMEILKNESLNSIQHTANVSEQTAAASEELAASVNTQLKIFEEMSESATELNNLATDMDNSLKKYKL